MAFNKSNDFENTVLKDWFNSVAHLLGNDLFIGLSITPYVDDSSVPNLVEATYTGYARIAVSRNGTGGWTVTGSTVSNAAVIQFGANTGGSTDVIQSAMIHDSLTGGTILIAGELLNGATLSVSNGVQPQFAAGSLQFEEK